MYNLHMVGVSKHLKLILWSRLACCLCFVYPLQNILKWIGLEWMAFCFPALKVLVLLCIIQLLRQHHNFYSFSSDHIQRPSCFALSRYLINIAEPNWWPIWLPELWLLRLHGEDPFNSNINIKKEKGEAEKHGLSHFSCLLNFGNLKVQNFSAQLLICIKLWSLRVIIPTFAP